MEEPKKGIVGGLVLQSRELLKIAKEKDCIGLAFGLSKPGVTNSVDLNVYKVSKKGTDYFGEERFLKNKKGAGALEGPPSKIHKYVFEFGKELSKCKFDFAFLSLAELELVLKDKPKEVFIGGGIKKYGRMGSIKGDWFTLTISPRSIVKKETPVPPRPLGAQPESRLLDSCPPKWTLQKAAYDARNKSKDKANEGNIPGAGLETGSGKKFSFKETE